MGPISRTPHWRGSYFSNSPISHGHNRGLQRQPRPTGSSWGSRERQRPDPRLPRPRPDLRWSRADPLNSGIEGNQLAGGQGADHFVFHNTGLPGGSTTLLRQTGDCRASDAGITNLDWIAVCVICLTSSASGSARLHALGAGRRPGRGCLADFMDEDTAGTGRRLIGATRHRSIARLHIRTRRNRPDCRSRCASTG